MSFFLVCSPTLDQRYGQVQIIIGWALSLNPWLFRCMSELMLCPETLILELWRALINSVVKHKGISKQEQAVTLNQADPGLSKSERVVIGTWNTKIRCWALCGTEHLETFLKEELVPWSLLHCNYEQCKSTLIRLLITTPVFDFHSVESCWT